MDIRTVGIVGTGQMGSGIGQVAAQAGMAVLLYDVNQEIVDRALGNIQKGLVRLTDRGKLSLDEQRAILGRLRGTAVLEDLGVADVVIEAAPEDSAIKEDIFRKLDRIARPEVILASNTSSISLTQLGAVTNRPGKVIGMHFMNPPGRHGNWSRLYAAWPPPTRPIPLLTGWPGKWAKPRFRPRTTPALWSTASCCP